MFTDRPFIKFFGVAYPHIKSGSNSTSIISARLSDRDAVYNDPAMVLCEKDLEAFNGLDGKPICVEHDRENIVGQVHHHWIGKDGKLRISGRIFTDTVEGRRIAHGVKHGNFSGLSVGYHAKLDQDTKSGLRKVTHKDFHEISVCKEPFFDNCYISVTGSKKPDYKSTKKNSNNITIRFDIMASEQKQTEQTEPTAPEPVPEAVPQVPHEEASELLQETDKLKDQLTGVQQEKAATVAKMTEMEKELAMFRAEAKKRQEEYAKAQQSKLEEAIEYYSKTVSPDKLDGMKHTLAGALLNPKWKETGQMFYQPVAAHKKQVEEQEKLKADNKALLEKLKKMQEEGTYVAASIKSTRNELANAQLLSHDVEEEKCKVAVKASGNIHLSDIMKPSPIPSKQEMSFLAQYGFGAGVGDGVDVNASSVSGYTRSYSTEYTDAPGHAYLFDKEGDKMFPASMRYHQPNWFDWMTKMSKVPTQGLTKIHHTLDRVDPDQRRQI